MAHTVGLEVSYSTRLRLVLYELLDLPLRAIIYVEYSQRCINYPSGKVRGRTLVSANYTRNIRSNIRGHFANNIRGNPAPRERRRARIHFTLQLTTA